MKPHLNASLLHEFIRSTSHASASIVLVFLGISHVLFAGLQIDSQGSLPNLVFPIITNDFTHITAGFLEVGLAIYLYVFRNSKRTGLLIILFIFILLVYRLGLYLQGSITCNCLGLLGRLLRISAYQEQVTMYITLGILCACAAPSTISFVRSLLKNDKSKKITVFIAFYIFCSSFGAVANNIEYLVTGKLNSTRLRPRLQTPFTNTTLNADFSVKLQAGSWELAVTNSDNPIWKTLLSYDGTNTTVLNLATGHPWLDRPPASTEQIATVSPGPAYLPTHDDFLSLALVWLAFGFSPDSHLTNSNQSINLPLPWKIVRNINACSSHGYRWDIDGRSGRFASDIKMIRDHALDETDEKELLRFDTDYPMSQSEYNERLESLADRKRITNGYVAGKFLIRDWYNANTVQIPKQAMLIYYLESSPNRPYYRGTLQAEQIKITRNPTVIKSPTIEVKTVVKDYRYKEKKAKKIFRYAEYSLMPGEKWKTANDDGLLAEREKFFNSGPRYDSYRSSKQVFVWLVIVMLLMTMYAVTRINKTKTQQ
jgi:hypothetical protein